MFESSSITLTESSDLNQLIDKKGAIYFPNTQLTKNEFEALVNRHTKQFSNNAERRVAFNDQNTMSSVDVGSQEIPLHSETSFSPAQPQLLWFYCSRAEIGNKKTTTYCNGHDLFQALTSSTKAFFLSNPVTYRAKILMPKRLFAGLNKNSRPWNLSKVGASEGVLDSHDEALIFDYKKFAVEECPEGTLYFVNHLLPFFKKDEPQILDVLVDGQSIPTEIFEEIEQKAKELTDGIIWSPTDIIVFDNKKYMHGRNSLIDTEKREIILMQTKLRNRYIND